MSESEYFAELSKRAAQDEWQEERISELVEATELISKYERDESDAQKIINLLENVISEINRTIPGI